MVGRRTAGGRHQDGSGLASVRLGGPKLKIVGGNGGSFSRKKKKKYTTATTTRTDAGILLSDSEEMVLPNPVEMAKWARR